MPRRLPAGEPHRPDELAQLPHGRHGLPRDFVERNHRERLIVAFIYLVGEVGYAGASITRVFEEAGVSSRAFYEIFDDLDECCIAAFDKGVDGLRPVLGAAYASEPEWPLRVRAFLDALLADLADWPALTRLLTVEPFVAGPTLAHRHKDLIEEMVPWLREGRKAGAAAAALPDTLERALLGAVNSMIGRQVMLGRGGRLGDLLPDLTQFVLTPYLGAAAARDIARG